MYLLIVFLPLLGSVVSGCFGYRIGEKGSISITTVLVGISSLCSIYSVYEVGIVGNKVNITIGRWVDVLDCNWGFKFDSLTVVMLVLVTVVSTLVHIYSMEYMEEDGHRSRFFSYLSLFTFFMIMLVTADNYLSMFLGWEGVGLCSYLLINFWYTRIEANKSAIQAMLVNRIGDVGLALGVVLIYIEFGSLKYDTVFSLSNGIGENGLILKVIGILLFIGAVGKSAQVGLHVWLPMAMEGPTPVSALIHAATMVTAGVFLLGRSSALLEYSSDVLWLITVVGGMTAVFAATTGLVQNDVKKVVAYSTASQLGYMVFACGLSCYSVGIFHLLNHGLFKALLFLSAGSIIHGIGDEQDMRKMGGLVRILPFTYSMVFIGSMALIGFPFLTGFYSKDVILESAYVKGSLEGFSGIWVFGLGSLSALFTSFYSMRLMHLVFLSKVSNSRVSVEYGHEGGWKMTMPLLILSGGSIWIGYLCKDMIIGVGTDFWNNALFIHPSNQIMLEGEFLPVGVKWFATVMSLSGVVLAWVVYTYKESSLYGFKMRNKRLYIFLNRKWYFDKMYNDVIVQSMMNIAYKVTYKGIDKGVLEVFGPLGVSVGVFKSGYFLSKLQTGNIYNYIFVMLVGILCLY